MNRGRLRGLIPLFVWLGGCVLGYRGEASFTGEHGLEQTQELRIALPDTPISVVTCAADVPQTCPERLTYEGRWRSVAGSRADARADSSAATLVFEREEGFATLRAEIPLRIDGLVDLEMDQFEVPDDRDLELQTGRGDVSVEGTRATVVVDIGVGDVAVRGADRGLAVQTGRGDISVTTPGHAELHTGEGHVEVEQSGDARDLFVTTGAGDITVTLASDADVDLQIRTLGRITVRTPTITSVTTQALSRRNGTGLIRVVLSSSRGAIDVRTVDPG